MGRATCLGLDVHVGCNTCVVVKINSHADAKAFLDSQGGNWRHGLASNIAVEREIGDLYGPISITLYDTKIITYFPDETFSVNNGGFNTPTTSRRVTQFTPDGYVFFHKNKKLVGTNGEREGERLPVKKR